MSDESTKMPDAAGLCDDGPCLEAQKHLWDYLDGELSREDYARIEAHVEECQLCDELFRSERKIKIVVARACSCEQAPQVLRGRILAMVSQLRIEMCGERSGERSGEWSAGNAAAQAEG